MNYTIKKSFFLVLATTMLVFAACSSGDDDNEGNTANVVEKYEQKFEKKYGKVASDRDWGLSNYSRYMKEMYSFSLFSYYRGIFTDDDLNKIKQSNFYNVTNPHREKLKWGQFYIVLFPSDINEDITIYVKKKDNDWMTYDEGMDIGVTPSKFFMNCTGDIYLQYRDKNGKIRNVTDYHLIYNTEKSAFYFMGFDVDGDNDYDDYIIGLTEYHGGSQVGFMIEETSDNPDFDFNDLVFSIEHYTIDDEIYVQYIIYAIGTTQPVYINDSKELHSMFGESQSTKISVGEDVESFPVIYTEKERGDLKVKIGNYTYNINDLLHKKGYVPNVLCVPSLYYHAHRYELYEGGMVYYSWVNEGVPIEDKYIYLPKYVTGQADTFH